MNTKELAALLDGREYLKELSDGEAALAKAHGLVIIFGASDDLMEFRGAIDDEFGCFDGADVPVTGNGILKNDCDNDGCPYYERAKKAAAVISAVFDSGEGYTWTYKTDIPHETFDIMEDGGKYCRGTVFALTDVPA